MICLMAFMTVPFKILAQTDIVLTEDKEYSDQNMQWKYDDESSKGTLIVKGTIDKNIEFQLSGEKTKIIDVISEDNTVFHDINISNMDDHYYNYKVDINFLSSDDQRKDVKIDNLNGSGCDYDTLTVSDNMDMTIGRISIGASGKTLVDKDNNAVPLILLCGHEHKAGEIDRVDPTCTEPGKETTYCEYCDIIIDEKILDPIGHGPIVIEGAKNATYTEEGYTRDKVCQKCGALLEKGEAIPMLIADNDTVSTNDNKAADTADDETDNNIVETGDDFSAEVVVLMMLISAAGAFFFKKREEK